MYATEMQLKVLFEKKLHGRSDFKKKNNNKVVSLSTLFLMFTLTSDRKQKRRILWEEKHQNSKRRGDNEKC